MFTLATSTVCCVTKKSYLCRVAQLFIVIKQSISMVEVVATDCICCVKVSNVNPTLMDQKKSVFTQLKIKLTRQMFWKLLLDYI